MTLVTTATHLALNHCMLLHEGFFHQAVNIFGQLSIRKCLRGNLERRKIVFYEDLDGNGLLVYVMSSYAQLNIPRCSREDPQDSLSGWVTISKSVIDLSIFPVIYS